MKKNEIRITLLLSSLCFLFSGCWSIIGTEKTLIYHDEVNLTWVYLGIGFLLILFILQILFLRKQEANQHILETILSAIFATVFSFTILGALSAWFWEALTNWNVFGIIIIILLCFIGGFRGLFPIIGYLLYWLYQDEKLLLYAAIPNTLGYLVLTLLLFRRANDITQNN